MSHSIFLRGALSDLRGGQNLVLKGQKTEGRPNGVAPLLVPNYSEGQVVLPDLRLTVVTRPCATLLSSCWCSLLATMISGEFQDSSTESSWLSKHSHPMSE